MLDEIDRDAKIYGHKVLTLREKIKKLRENRLAFMQKIGLRSNPNQEEYWIDWLNTKLDHLNGSSSNSKENGLNCIELMSASQKIKVTLKKYKPMNGFDLLLKVAE
jgi:hypothetical protein